MIQPLPLSRRARATARVRAGTLLLLLAALTGCGLQNAVRGAAGSAVAGARSELASDSTAAAVRALTGSATSGLAEGIRGDLQPAIDTTLVAALGRSRMFISSTQDSLAIFLAGPLSNSLQALIRGNVQTLGASLDAQMDPLFARAGEGLRAQLALTFDETGGEVRRVLIPLVGEAVDSVSLRLATNAHGPLRLAIDSIVASAVRSGVRAADESSRPILNRITGAVMGVLAVVCGGFLLWLHYDRRKTRRALLAVTRAIRDTEDEGVRETIKDRVKVAARHDQIDGYLHTFLEEHQLLGTGAARVPVPKLVGDDAAAAAAEARRP